MNSDSAFTDDALPATLGRVRIRPLWKTLLAVIASPWIVFMVFLAVEHHLRGVFPDWPSEVDVFGWSIGLQTALCIAMLRRTEGGGILGLFAAVIVVGAPLQVVLVIGLILARHWPGIPWDWYCLSGWFVGPFAAGMIHLAGRLFCTDHVSGFVAEAHETRGDASNLRETERHAPFLPEEESPAVWFRPDPGQRLRWLWRTAISSVTPAWPLFAAWFLCTHHLFGRPLPDESGYLLLAGGFTAAGAMFAAWRAGPADGVTRFGGWLRTGVAIVALLLQQFACDRLFFFVLNRPGWSALAILAAACGISIVSGVWVYLLGRWICPEYMYQSWWGDSN